MKPYTFLTLQLASRDINAYYFTGNKGGKRPGLVFLHDITGIQNSTLETAYLLSEEGLRVLVPDLYTNSWGVKYCVRQVIDRFIRDNLSGNKALEEIHQIIDAFQKFKDVDPNRLSLVGSCLTGGFVLHASLRPEIKAPVVFHHSFGLTGSGFPEECVGSVKHTIQGHFCHTDPLCPPEKVDRLEEQLGDKLERHDYDLPHMIPHLFRFNEEGKEAYERMLRFIKEKVYE